MGTALAEAAHALGADVYFITGPAPVIPTNTAIQVEKVRTAADMFKAVKKQYSSMDICILAAAVADYTPLQTAKHKLKKSDTDLQLSLTRTVDIAAYIGQQKSAHQLLIGFALETQNGVENAQKKRIKKNMDMIVLNSMSNDGAGFERYQYHPGNQIGWRNHKFPKKSKKSLAFDILEQAQTLI